MKKILTSIIIAFIAFVAIGYYRVNQDKPQNIEIKSYSINEDINFDGLEIRLTDISKTDNDKGENISANRIKATYKVKNKIDENLDALPYILSLTYNKGLDESFGQNIIDSDKELKKMNKLSYDTYYLPEDFIINSREEKTFEIYYKDTSSNDYPSCLLFSNKLYMDKYKEKLNKGIFYYELIDLGDESWSFLIWELLIRKN